MAAVFLGRILHQDDDFVTMEIPKRGDIEIEVRDGDAFLSLVFVQPIKLANGSVGGMTDWNPFEEKSDD